MATTGEPLGKDKQSLAKAILAAHEHLEHKKRKDVYCLGPSIGRINFMSQQYRALNLAWALMRSGQLENKGRRIAVVGAGLSGITFAVAMAMYGATVTVFESRKDIMHRQKAASHRFIYPLMNWWPESPDVDYLNPTSNLPFMNWKADICNLTTKEIAEEWETISHGCGNRLQFDAGKEFIRIEHLDGNLGKPVLVLHKVENKETITENSEIFDIIVLAVGFKNERPAGRFPSLSYWTQDQLEDERAGTSGAFKHFIVSGVGDGGLIDALRLAFQFDDGRLAYRVALLLHNTPAEAEIRGFLQELDVEKAREGYRRLAREILNAPYFLDQARTRRAEAIAALEVATQADRDRQEAMRIAADIDIARFEALLPVERYIKKNLHGDQHFITIINRKHACPLYGDAAPIYKLLTAIAIAHGCVKTERGVVQPIFTGDKRGKLAEVKSIGIYAPGGRKCLSKWNRAKTRVIVRHGADQMFQKVMSRKAYRQAIAIMERVAEFSHQPAWHDDADEDGTKFHYPQPQIHGDMWENRRRTLRVKAEGAYRAIDSMAVPSFQDDHFYVMEHEGRYRPKSIYGYPVIYGGAFADLHEEVQDD